MAEANKSDPIRHLIDNMPLDRTIVMQIEAPRASKKRHGDNVFQIVGPSSVLLESRGWMVVKRGKRYTYMRPPRLAEPPFTIEFTAPSREQIIAIAELAHAIGGPAKGHICEGVFGYLPERTYSVTPVDAFTGKTGPTERGGTINPYFVVVIGEWRATVMFEGNGHSYYEQAEGVQGLACLETQMSLLIDPPDDFFEGALCRAERNSYEREQAARAACIERYGTLCQACGIDLVERYGRVAEGFIHVHHLTPICSIGQNYKVDPVRDLRPVCPTCHSIMHLKEPPYTVEQVRSFLRIR